MSKKPGLYANIHAKRKRGEKMRKPGEEGAPSAQDFRDAAKTAKKKKADKRQDPGRKMYDKDGCKMCDGGKKPCRCGKADMGRKGPYADGMCSKRGDIAAEFNGVLINDEEERADKPCGNSHIPQSAKCTKGAGQAKKAPEKGTIAYKQSHYGLKQEAFGKPYGKTLTNKQVRQVERGMIRQMQRTGKKPKLTEAQEAALVSTRGTYSRKRAAYHAAGAKRANLRAIGKAGKNTSDPLLFAAGRVARRELLNRNVLNLTAGTLYAAGAAGAIQNLRRRR